MSNGSRNKIIIGTLVLGAAVTGAYLLMTRGGAPAADDGAEASFQPAARPAATTTSSSGAPAAVAATESQDGMGVQRETTTTFSFNANAENEAMLEEAMKEAQAAQARDSLAPKPDAAGRTEFKNLAVSLKVASGWIAGEEPSPMPNVAMITFTKPEFAAAQQQQQMPGAVPVVILTVEDIASEALNLVEFKEKSKQMALTQMQMMTGGMFQPQVTYDDSMTVGEFGHCLEYAQRTPYFTMEVMNLLAVKNGLAYVLQLMGSPEVMSQTKNVVMEMARSVVIENKPTTFAPQTGSAMVVTTDNVQISVPATWMTKDTASDALVTFKTQSLSKAEAISVYAADKCPVTEAPSSGKVVSSKIGGRSVKAVSNGTFAIVCAPENASGAIVTTDQFLEEALASATAVSAAAEPVFRNVAQGYEFVTVPGCKIIESRLGDGTVVYAPTGAPQTEGPVANTHAEGPIVTIRVGDKKTDPDCEETLDEWYAKLQADAANAPILELRKTKVGAKDAITFINKEMQEIGAGQKEERQGRVYIFVENKKTTLIRWETSTGNWRKFERKLDAMMDSFNLL